MSDSQEFMDAQDSVDGGKKLLRPISLQRSDPIF